MKAALLAAVTILTSFVPTVAEAAILNGGFEDDFTGWQAIGDYRIETSSGNGVQGNQAFLSTAFQEVIDVDENGNETVGGNAACVSFISGFCPESLELFFNASTFEGDTFLDDIATATPIEGSAIKQTFTAEAGQTLSFSWNFLTNESVDQAALDDSTYPDFNDFAFVSIQSDTTNELLSLADTIANFSPSNSSFDSETQFRTFSYAIPTTGTYTLGIGVVDVGEPTRISGLLIDSVAVPEADTTVGTLAMLLVGAGYVTSQRLRRLKK